MKETGKNRKKLKYTLDGNRGTYWEADTKTPVLDVDLGKDLTFPRL